MELRQIQTLTTALRGIEPNKVKDTPPIMEWVDPCTLLVDERYQRQLSEKSIKLIRRIVSGWSWRKFKPPIVARTADGDEIIDGQHTTMGAAAHPEINKIPIFILTGTDLKERAKAFVSHNSDRLGITPLQLFHSSLAAGDEEAVDIENVCRRAGIRILKSSPAIYPPSSTVAVAAMRHVIRVRYPAGLGRVLRVLAGPALCPITANHIRAVDALLFDSEFGIHDAVVAATVMKKPNAEEEARVISITHKIPVWRGLAIVWFRSMRKISSGSK